MSKFKKGDRVRVVHTAGPSTIPLNSVKEVVEARNGGVFLRQDDRTGDTRHYDAVFFYDNEVEPTTGMLPSEVQIGHIYHVPKNRVFCAVDDGSYVKITEAVAGAVGGTFRCRVVDTKTGALRRSELISASDLEPVTIEPGRRYRVVENEIGYWCKPGALVEIEPRYPRSWKDRTFMWVLENPNGADKSEGKCLVLNHGLVPTSDEPVSERQPKPCFGEVPARIGPPTEPSIPLAKFTAALVDVADVYQHDRDAAEALKELADRLGLELSFPKPTVNIQETTF